MKKFMLDAEGIPTSRNFVVGFCGACPNAHLIFYDRHGNALAHATIAASQARLLVREIEKRDPNFVERET